jgi:hypothetical protein
MKNIKGQERRGKSEYNVLKHEREVQIPLLLHAMYSGT